MCIRDRYQRRVRGSAGTVMDMQSPPTPKTPGTLVRAKKSAVPLRQEIQDQVDQLQRRNCDVTGADGDLGTAMNGLDQSLLELENRIHKEFEEMKERMEEQMKLRQAELIAGAKDHFEKLTSVMAQQRELLKDEEVRVKAKVEEALEALGLDDAWFIQAYPDIDLAPGASHVNKSREVLNGGNGALGLSFDERVMSDVLLPAVRGHGKLISSFGNNVTSDYSPSPRSSPRSPRRTQPIPQAKIYDYIDDNSTTATDGSVLEKQVETMLKTVH
eukprot:TRINITY_DN8642_c0_g1_i1.p1 TRINITY_DN8642_c0_g1~~TRINITY_DN8642_c0_g1_i1.p1  ORF type:complete len:272 (+),score=86.77 TRINITY_DN8642_c0_g1_i1:204-1019(+)